MLFTVTSTNGFYSPPSPPLSKSGWKLHGLYCTKTLYTDKSENSQDYARKPQQNCIFNTSAAVGFITFPSSQKSFRNILNGQGKQIVFHQKLKYPFRTRWQRSKFTALIRARWLHSKCSPLVLTFLVQQGCNADSQSHILSTYTTDAFAAPGSVCATGALKCVL